MRRSWRKLTRNVKWSKALIIIKMTAINLSWKYAIFIKIFVNFIWVYSWHFVHFKDNSCACIFSAFWTSFQLFFFISFLSSQEHFIRFEYYQQKWAFYKLRVKININNLLINWCSPNSSPTSRSSSEPRKADTFSFSSPPRAQHHKTSNCNETL